MDIDIPADPVPAELKSSCEQILKRARELRKVDPVMSYWCCFSAATACMKVAGKRSDQGMKFLLNLVSVIEETKSTLLTLPTIDPLTITDESTGSAYVEDFAMRVFTQADDEDRGGRSDKHSIRKFMVASQFLDVLRCFEPPNGMREELEQKQQYAKWKATDIARALREGRRPVAGPPLSAEEAAVDHMLPGDPTRLNDTLPNDGPSFPPIPSNTMSTSPPTASVSGSGSRSRPIDLSSSHDDEDELNSARQDSLDGSASGSGTWSTAATPGLRDGDDLEKLFPSTTTTATTGGSSSRDVSSDRAVGSSGSGDGGDGEDGERVAARSGESATPGKNVRFVGPDGAPLSPPSTVFSMESYTAPGNPPPSEFDDGGDAGLPTPLPSHPSTARQTTLPSAPASTHRSNLTPSAASIPPPSRPITKPSAPQHTQPSAPPAPPSTPANLPQTLDRRSIEQCQKHAKWAVSALDYEDLDTARAELRKALALLGVPS